ncbi:molecular chaperone HtpG [Kallotenue papyrolyticum]|uniref:molecular chaperone HtpG n=1 Tax=Kallotenue papyrolyticum TaxID=1325125 RepID=UPI00047857E6|nr:molecular chaperone HtpG [Kallotenue papyrolyticum]
MSERPESFTFRAEVQQLLHILSHALYTDREIFLRELISNSSDALHRMRVLLLTEEQVVDRDAELAIRITSDEQAGTISVSDTGIGMTHDEIIENLGTIAHSGAKAIMEQLAKEQRSDLIGQFGVGFYSVFAVAERVVVTSRSYRPDAQAVRWEAHGGDSYTVAPDDRTARGTTVTVHLRQDAKEFAQPWRIRQIVKKHSDFIAFPIYLGDEQINQTKPLWRRAPREIERATYVEFYRQLTMDWDEPLHVTHLSTDAPLDLHAILFVPARRERGLIERRIEGRVKLYSRSVLIQEDARELVLPDYFRFVEGVVDSEDLPLNVSRESVQRTPEIGRIRKTLTGRLTKELSQLAEKEPERYATFWREFGIFLKEGIAVDPGARDDLLKLLRFHTSRGDELISLAQYKERMVEGQRAIYYVLAGDLESARHSPHLDALAARGIEALLLVDLVDSFLVNSLREYEGLKLINADSPDLELPALPEEPAAEALPEEAFARLAERAKAVLGERVTEVRASQTLRQHPARLVAADGQRDRDLQRVQRLLNRDYQAPSAVLELNPRHALIRRLADLSAQSDDGLVPLLIEQLYDSALLLDGLHPNPAHMVPRIQRLMELAAAARDDTPAA